MTELLRKAYNPEEFRKNAHELVDLLADHIISCQKGSEPKVLPWLEPEYQLEKWNSVFRDRELNNKEFWSGLIEGSNRLHSRGFMGHQVASPTLFSGLGDLVNGILNNSSAVYEMGPVVTAMERVVVKWLTSGLGFGDQSEGIITSGGSLGNLTAILAARQSKAPFNIWKEGFNPDFRPAIIVSKEAHYSIARAVQVLGWGEEGIIAAPVDNELRLDSSSLPDMKKEAEKKGRTIIAVIANACTTSTGSYDPLEEIADFCEDNGLWMHVDGAHGGFAALSPKYEHLTRGINRADSVVIDFHKMMGLSSLATAVLFKDKDPSYDNFAQDASYILDETKSYEWFNSAKRTIECTKNMMAAKVFAILKQLGPQFFIDYLETCYDNGALFAGIINSYPDFELALEPRTNIVCFRYNDGLGDTSGLNRINHRVWKDSLEDGQFYIVQTRINDINYLRTSLMNPFTGEKEMKGLLDYLANKIKSYE